MKNVRGGWTDTVETKNGKFVYIDTSDTSDVGWETIVVRAGENGEPLDCVDNWVHPLLMAHYETRDEAAAGHKLTVAQFQEYNLDNVKGKKNRNEAN